MEKTRNEKIVGRYDTRVPIWEHYQRSAIWFGLCRSRGQNLEQLTEILEWLIYLHRRNV
jgi:hypothetical protein